MSRALDGARVWRLMTCGKVIDCLAARAFDGEADKVFRFRQFAVTRTATDVLHHSCFRDSVDPQCAHCRCLG